MVEVGKMVEKILEKGDRREELQTGFVLHIILTCIIRSIDDRVEFRGKRCKGRWFPMAIHWTTGAVKQRNKGEKEFPGEHGRGKTINRVDNQKIIHESENEFPEQPCPECDGEREPLIAGPSDPIEVENLFEDPNFFYEYSKMEAVALKHYQGRMPIKF
ncbi:hypothetical protein Cgig2_028160 [Carnegiea gigantea]|uniref:Uncharacterized protein n=1 Tax=Carnegiea gigantea TaxID=171969 RepID=A0A9Q1Q9E2_9CARY|nr:hypothetical protein Cgig2_028160 [Carnegiea gigantea]